ncbi:MAG: serpin family protein [Clostridia bacterium]|nr:serpin family protein [Clostridia bacterium]
MKRLISMLLLVGMITASLSGCYLNSSELEETDLPDHIAEPIKAVNLLSQKKSSAKNQSLPEATAVGFSLTLLRQALDEEDSVCISPLSILAALGMTANGAAGDTLAQLEAAFGMSTAQLNDLISHYMQGEDEVLHTANSIWMKDDGKLEIKESFLDAVGESYYGAGLFKAPFDQSTVADINAWVKENTKDRIAKMIDRFSGDEVVCLINALSFDAEWQSPYNEYSIRPRSFTTASGEVQEASMMYSTERAYLEDEHAVGFIKYYKDRKYAFAALLPEEGMSLADYAAMLTDEKLTEMLKNPISVKVEAGMPKFEQEYSVSLNDILKMAGITDLFGAECDLSAMGSYAGSPLYVSSVLHKTYIKVDGKGTEAGAATAVIAAPTSAVPSEDETKLVILDRPYLYIIFDCELGVPIFMGAVSQIN